MVQQDRRTPKRTVIIVAIVCVAMMFVFVSARALMLMGRSGADIESSVRIFDYEQMDATTVHNYLRALERLGLRFD